MEGKVFSEDLIREQLDDILASPPFRHSRLLSHFLNFVVEETLAGRENQIKEYTIATQVLGRSPGFMTQKDASVRIHAMRLRKLLFDYYAHGNGNIKVIIELPKGSYRPVFTPMNGRHVPIMEHGSGDSRNRDSSGRICVVPFSYLVDLPETSFSNAGFCEYLSEKLSMFEDVSVVSFHAIDNYLAAGGRVGDLGAEFDLVCYLTGSIEISNEEVIVSVQLFDANENVLIWSNEHKANISGGDIFEIIELISKRIVSSIGGYTGYAHFRLFQQDLNKPRISGKLGNAVFWFYHYVSKQNMEIHAKAVKELEHHVQEDGTFALSHALLAHLYCDAIVYGYDTSPERIAAAKELAAKSLALDPECQHGYLAKAWIHVVAQEWDEARAAADQMLSLNPNSSYFMSLYSLGMAMMHEYEKSHRYWEEALLLNPLPFWWLSFSPIFKALSEGRYEVALFHARKVGTPKIIYEGIFEMICLYQLGRLEKMRELKQKHVQQYPGGLDHVLIILPLVVKDPELRKLIRDSLEAIIHDDPDII